MTYQLIHKGVCVENFIQPSLVQRALKWWKENGMAGTYEVKEQPRVERAQITLAKFK